MLRAASFFAFGLALSCAATPASPSGGAGNAGAGGTGGSAGAGGSTGGSGGGSGGIVFGGSGGSAPCAEQFCSSDLHSVVDCYGNVVISCPPDQGCGPNLTCVPACEAADGAKSNIGCEFYTQQTSFGCFAAFVANTWNEPITLAVDSNGISYDPSQFTRIPSGNGQGIVYSPLPGGMLPAGEVAIVFLAGQCPGGVVPPGNFGPTPYHITSSRPVVAYDIDPYGGGASAVTSATLLIPTSAWDKNYVVVAPWPFGPNSNNPRLVITANEDATDITLNPKVTLVAWNGGADSPANVPVTFTLNKGQSRTIEQQEELTGSPILATKPIGVTGSSGCINIDACCCDGAHQQIPPVRALGSEYVGVRYRNRVDNQEESPPWRLVGAVDGTVLTWESPPPDPMLPMTLSAGQVVSFRGAGPFVVRSQDADHPFYMSGYMTGAGDFQDRGDPEFVNVIPAAQYLSSYVFFTDPTYPESNLVLVRKKGADDAFHDVTLDCAGVLGGWQPIGASGDYEYTRFDVVRFNFQKQGNCDNGRHEITSTAPFGLTVWGWGTHDTDPAFTSTYVSYAYPAGAGVQSINAVVVDPIPN